MQPLDHQAELAMEGYEVLRKHMLVYLAMEERTGKTITALEICEIARVQRVGILTKKKALDGWNETLCAWDHEKTYFLKNYHQHAQLPRRLDLIILDEAHNYLSGYPKPSAMWKAIRELCRGIPIIYLSATPHAQGRQLLFHQLKLNSWSPWQHNTFYSWFREYGIPHTIKVHDKDVMQYTRVKDEKIIKEIDHLFITKTRKELGFEHEPEDVLHYIELGDETKLAYNQLLEWKVLEIRDLCIIADTTMKLRSSLHALEGGTLKHWKWAVVRGERKKVNDYLILANDEKIQYILKTWGDTKDVVIMYQYKGEKTKLEKIFKFAKVLQATSFAEGVDLSAHGYLVIYSQDWSTARHSQRRARQANMARTAEIKVHFLIVKKAISSQVYKTVSINKRNFVDSVFERTKL